jgi:hypothetical protein
MRALLVALDEWVSNGTPPPENRIPTRKDGMLVPAEESVAKFPRIPGVNHISRVNQTYALYGLVSARSAQTQYTSLVPKTDADGNDLGGIRLPDVTVPLGTHTGWAVRADIPGEMCGNLGQFIPFAKTKAERNLAVDPRLSLFERYPKQTVYLGQITQAVNALQAERLLLPEDAAAYIADAEQKVATILALPPQEKKVPSQKRGRKR